MDEPIKITLICGGCGVDVKEANEILAFLMKQGTQITSLRYRLADYNAIKDERDYLRLVVKLFATGGDHRALAPAPANAKEER